jgi:hypothetical protein
MVKAFRYLDLVVGMALAVNMLASNAMGALPTDVTIVPFYDITKPGLSFAKDKQSVVGMWEVPGKPQHFLVLGYWGYIWTLFPDTTKSYAKDAIKDYSKNQVADFNTKVMKGWEQGALGGAFDPNFATNHYFYIIYNKYAAEASYHGGLAPTSVDGPGAQGLVVVERWKLSADYKSLTRDTTIFSANHFGGYGSSNMVFGKDGLLYISADAYSQNSWDSTIYMRKILRIDVSKPEKENLYTIPPTNPFYNAANPSVKKEIFAFGFRNTYSITSDYVTGAIWGAEVGQVTWEEVNIIKSGKNYGWADGGDGASNGGNSWGIEGPCSPTGQAWTAANPDFSGGGITMDPYSRTYKGKTYTCADFTNATWNFAHNGQSHGGVATAVPGLEINCIILSQAYRGDPTSALYGYHFVTDVNKKYFVAVKEGIPGGVKVGGVPTTMEFNARDLNHNGPTSFSEDAYGNMYVTMLSSSGTGAFDWHDIYRLSSSEMKPLANPRDQVFPTPVSLFQQADRLSKFHNFIVNSANGIWVKIPAGYTRVEIYHLNGKLAWTGKVGGAGTDTQGDSIKLPAGIKTGTLGIRFLP